ncbi:MAG: ribosome-associated translation inhibitor RaiA [Candidatus Harrisonbacteria bacterium]|nr:ribosome-associated translation inhibitor RaiA [Candidatus Harrisonbacteria bacterium]
MKLQIKATGFELTPSLQKLIEDKFNSLEKFLAKWETNRELLLRVEIAKNTKHHNKGMVWYAEANLDLPQKVLRIEEINEEMQAAIEKLKDRLKNDLLKVKEKSADH